MKLQKKCSHIPELPTYWSNQIIIHFLNLLSYRHLPSCVPSGDRRELYFPILETGWTLQFEGRSKCRSAPVELGSPWRFRQSRRHRIAASVWAACISQECVQSPSAAPGCCWRWSSVSLRRSLRCPCNRWTDRWNENAEVRWIWNRV